MQNKMLEKRINFGKALQPFEGYEMDYALGTSYSLSLEALMFIPITLFFGEEFNTSEKVITSEMFEALTKVPDQVQMFCQRGKMIKPNFYHNILAFWEDSIEQIHMDSHLKSFHPKIWLVRYKPFDARIPIKYKFLCTSRNLTLCRDWDVALHMDGQVKKKKIKNNQPLFDFINMLNSQAKRKVKPEILEEIMHIDFELNEDQLDYAFHPIGFSNYKNPLLANNKKHEKLLAISPFVDITTIKAYTKNSKEFFLLSNAFDLNSIDSKHLPANKTFMFNPTLDQVSFSEPDNLTQEDGQTQEILTGDVATDESYKTGMSLHAKLYIEQNGKDVNWYVGSANCTDPAKERNIEFLTEIKFNSNKVTVNEVLKQLTQPNHGQGLFIPYQSMQTLETEETKETEAILRKLIFDLASLKFKGTVKQREDNRFDMEIIISDFTIQIPSICEVSIIPLSALNAQPQFLNPQQKEQTFIFNDFEESMLTPYLLCSINYGDGFLKQLVLDMEIEFGPDRMKKIFKSIISNQDKLFLYLSALLSKEDSAPLLELSEFKSRALNRNNFSLESMPLYEKLLVAASRDPKKIKIAKRTIESLIGEEDEDGNLIISEEFESFFNVFKSYGDEV